MSVFAENSEAEQCAKDYYASMGTDWDTYLKLTYSLERESAKNFINSEQCQKNHVGDLNVKSAKVTKLIEIPYDDPSIYSTTWEQERR